MKSKIFNPSYTGFRDDIFNFITYDITRVLDIGCSIGVLGEKIKRRYNSEVTGIEKDEKMAKVAKKKLNYLIRGDIENINLHKYFSENYFDCVIFADILEHLKNPWEVLRNSMDFLSNDGVVIISIPNVRHWNTIFNLVFKGYWPYRRRGIHDTSHLRFFTYKNIMEMLKYAELEVTTLKRKYRLLENPYRKMSFVNRFLKYVPIPILREFLVFQYIIVARKIRRQKL